MQRLDYIYNRVEQPFDFSNDEYGIDSTGTAVPGLINRRTGWTLAQKAGKWSAQSETSREDEAGIAEILKKRYQNQEKNIRQLQSEDVFQFIENVFCESFIRIPIIFHRKFWYFKIQLNQELKIGARLSTDDDIQLFQIIVGGPAD